MVSFVISVLIIIIFLLIIGLLKSKSLFECLLFINSIVNSTVIIIAILSSFEGNSSYIDIALIYTFLGFLASKGFLSYYK